VKSIKKLVTAALIGAMVVGATGCGFLEKTETNKAKEVVAKVGDEKITKGDVDEEIKYMIEQAKTQYGEDYASNEEAMKGINEQRKTTLSALVDLKLLLQYVKDNNIEINEDEMEAEVDNAYKQARDQYGSGDDATFEKLLQDNGYTLEKYKDDIKNAYISSKAREAMSKGAEVTDADIDASFKKDEFLTQNANAKFVQYLLCKVESSATPEDRAAKKKIADAALAEIKGGLSFTDAAKKYSDDPSTKDNGGYLGAVTSESGLVEGFKNVAIGLNPGQMSEVVDEPTFGFFIIKSISTDEAIAFEKEKQKTTLLQTKQSEKAEEILQQLRDEKSTKYEDKLVG